jgi:hypothetical protein
VLQSAQNYVVERQIAIRLPFTVASILFFSIMQYRIHPDRPSGYGLSYKSFAYFGQSLSTSNKTPSEETAHLFEGCSRLG